MFPGTRRGKDKAKAMLAVTESCQNLKEKAAACSSSSSWESPAPLFPLLQEPTCLKPCPCRESLTTEAHEKKLCKSDLLLRVCKPAPAAQLCSAKFGDKEV